MKIYCIRLIAEKCSIYDLANVIDKLFEAWNYLLSDKTSTFNKVFTSSIKRFFIRVDDKSGLYYAYFVLICLTEYDFTMQEYKFNFVIDINWLCALYKALSPSKKLNVEKLKLDKKTIGAAMNNFFDAKTFTCRTSQDGVIISKDIEKRQLITVHGIFDRDLSIEFER